MKNLAPKSPLRHLYAVAPAALAAFTSLSAFAQDAATSAAAAVPPPPPVPPPAINTGDTAWVIVATALVLLMTPGLAFFYGGMVRVKNVVATILQSFAAISIVSFVWWLVGYSLAFGTGSSLLGGTSWALFHGVGGAPNPDYAATIPHGIFATFQLMFAIITPALIAGAFAERMKFSAYVAFIALWSLVVYSPLAHWVWGTGGMIRGWGFLDFAGGMVVHQSAGFSALAAAIVFGRRTDYGKADTSPSSVPLIAIGTAMLWFGWFGFNGGSALASNELAVSAFNATHFAAMAAAFAWGIMDRILKGKFNLTGFCVGAVVGLVAVTPASGFVGVTHAIIIGIVGAVAANLVAYFRGKSQLDDSLDVFAAHGVGGLVGTLLTGVFCAKAINSGGADGGMAQFMIQLKGSVVGSVYCFVATLVILYVIKAVIGLRPTPEQEARGLDINEHGEKAYVN